MSAESDTEKEWGVERRNQPRLRGMQRMADVSKARILVRKRKGYFEDSKPLYKDSITEVGGRDECSWNT